MEYRGCGLFSSDRHHVQVASGKNKSSVWLLKLCQVAAVAVCFVVR